jgi:hypothetical protein
MLGCEVVREPTNRNKSFVGERREQQTNNSFSFLVLFLYSNHMMLAIDITLLHTQLDKCQQ